MTAVEPRLRQRMVAAAVVVLALTTLSAQAAFERSLEKTLGRQARQAIESQYVVVSEGAAAAYLERLGNALVTVSPRHDVQYTFKLLDSEQVNAFALPWGYVYVTTGMLDFVDSSDQLAGVVGHEIAHVAEKHSVNAFKKQFWTSVLLGVIEAPNTLLTMGKVGATLYLLRHSRKDEQTADRLGAGYIYAAGYDPSQLATFLRKLDQEHGRRLSTLEVYLSTHPTSERRQQRLAELPQLRHDDPTVAAHIAQGLLARHLANQAIVAYRRAVKLAPDNAAAHVGLARAYAELGEVQLSRQALQRAVKLGADDDHEIEALAAHSAAASPVNVLPLSQTEDNQIEQARTMVLTWKRDLEAPLRQIRERAESLDNDVRGLARHMSMSAALGQPTLESERITDKAQLALQMIAETCDRVHAIADTSEATAAGALEAVELMEKGLAAPTAIEDRALWLALENDIAHGVTRAQNQREEVHQPALQAAELADKAAAQLGSALSSLPSSLDVFGGLERGHVFLGLAEGELDDALRNAHAAREISRKAMALLRGRRADALSWRLSAAYLNAPPNHRPALHIMAAAMVSAEPDVLVPAAGEGFGSALLRAMRAPPPQPSADNNPASESGSEETSSIEASDYSDLMLGLVLADIQREAAARQQWKGAQAPTASPGAESVSTDTATSG